MPDTELIPLPKKINVVVEYRLTMPLSLEEYRRGQLYATAKGSWQTTMVSTGQGGTAGVIIKENLPCEGVSENIDTHGKHPDRHKMSEGGSQHTVKEIHFGRNLPKMVSAVLPKGAKFVEERCWNAFPYVLTLYTSKQSFLSSRLFISVESLHIEDDIGEKENVFELKEKELKNRSVVHIDIANDHVGAPPEETPPDSPASPASPASPVTPGHKAEVIAPTGDPRTYTSQKTGRGPLKGDKWREGCRENGVPTMTAYKLVRLVCDVPFHSKVEAAVLKSAIFDLVLNSHKNMFCTLDEWAWLDMETIRKYEEDAFAAAKAALAGDRTLAESLQPPDQPSEKPEWVPN